MELKYQLPYVNKTHITFWVVCVILERWILGFTFKFLKYTEDVEGFKNNILSKILKK